MCLSVAILNGISILRYINRYIVILFLLIYAADAQQPALLVNDFPGNDAGAKIAACIAALPSGGGVCDARGLTGNQTISSFTITKPVSLLIGAGNYSVTGTVTWQNVDGPSLVGVGTQLTSNRMTVFTWDGDATAPMFRLTGVRNSDFRFFTIKANNTKPVATAILSDSGFGRTLTTGNHFSDMNIDGTNGGIGKGFLFTTGGNGDVNDDANIFTRVRVSNFTIAGWSFEHSQSKIHEMYSCGCSGNGKGQYCVTTALGPRAQGGSFSWIGGGGGGESGADFYLGSPNEAINIINSYWEGSSRFVLTAGSSSNSWPVTLLGNKWHTNGLNADGKAVYYTHRGVLALYQNAFAGDVKNLQFAIVCSVSECRGRAEGNSIYSSVTNPFMGSGRINWFTVGNWRWDGTNWTTITDVILPTLTFKSLGTPGNGAFVYCPDCMKGSNPCSGSGRGTFAYRINGAWVCL